MLSFGGIGVQTSHHHQTRCRAFLGKSENVNYFIRSIWCIRLLMMMTQLPYLANAVEEEVFS